MQEPRLLILGAGKIGLPLARNLAQQETVILASRSARPKEPNLNVLQLDVTRPETLTLLPTHLHTLVYCLSPAESTDAAYEQVFVQGVRHLLQALTRHPPKRILFVSSTAVYHQDDDSWVNEESPTAPSGFSGQRLLQAEQLLHQSGIPSTVVRFSGIYGNTRTRLLDQMLSGAIADDPQGPYTNRIHEADCLGVLAHLVRLSLAGAPLAPCYLASDCAPVRIQEILDWLRGQVGDLPPRDDAAPATRRAGSKRCDNRRLLDSGYSFEYPSFREGYAPLLNRFCQR